MENARFLGVFYDIFSLSSFFQSKTLIEQKTRRLCHSPLTSRSKGALKRFIFSAFQVISLAHKRI